MYSGKLWQLATISKGAANGLADGSGDQNRSRPRGEARTSGTVTRKSYPMQYSYYLIVKNRT